MLGPIVVVAPFNPEGPGSHAAMHKLESVFRILALSGRRIILVDSTHSSTRLRRSHRRAAAVAGVPVTLITPFTLPWRPLGKAANLLVASSLARRIAVERPSLIWIYNSYAFETQVALMLERLTGAPIVLELEDLPRARRRGWLDLKPRLDAFYFRRLQKRAAFVTCVNEEVATVLHGTSCRKALLPYIVNRHLTADFDGKAPFSQPPYVLGYFGGLSEEKGAGMLLRFTKQLPAGWRMVVTGRGVLAGEFHRHATEMPEKLRFIENASDEQLYGLMAECDVIVNPHAPIEKMQQGVFPFKALEAVVTGRLLISTALPACGFDLRDAVLWFDGSAAGLLDALGKAEAMFVRNRSTISSTVDAISSQLAEPAVYSRLKAMGVPL